MSAAWRTWSRHELRWLRTIRTVQPAGYAFSFISFGVPTAALGCLLAGGADATLALLAVTAAARLMLHFAVCKTPLPPWRIGAVVLNDALGFALWCWGFTARRVQWRHVQLPGRSGWIRAPRSLTLRPTLRTART